MHPFGPPGGQKASTSANGEESSLTVILNDRETRRKLSHGHRPRPRHQSTDVGVEAHARRV